MWTTLIPDAEWANLRDDVANGQFIPPPAAAAWGQKAKLSIQWELKGLGSAYSGIAFTDADPLIQSCGWAGTFGASTWTYTPVLTAARPSCTVYGWANGNQYKVSGCRGNFEIRIRAGEIMQMRFTLEGVLTTVVTTASVPATTYTATIPPAAVAQTCTIGPWTPDYDEILVRSGNDAQWLYSGNAVYGISSGLQSYDFGLSKPEVEITARATGVATYDPYTDWTSVPPVSRAWTMNWGAVATNKGTITDTGLWIPSPPANINTKNFTAWRTRYRCTSPTLTFS